MEYMLKIRCWRCKAELLEIRTVLELKTLYARLYAYIGTMCPYCDSILLHIVSKDDKKKRLYAKAKLTINNTKIETNIVKISLNTVRELKKNVINIIDRPRIDKALKVIVDWEDYDDYELAYYRKCIKGKKEMCKYLNTAWGHKYSPRFLREYLGVRSVKKED